MSLGVWSGGSSDCDDVPSRHQSFKEVWPCLPTRGADPAAIAERELRRPQGVSEV